MQGEVNRAVCRFPSSLRAILGVTPPSKDTLFSEEEVLAALQQYAESFQLCQAAGLVKLNRLLVANLFNKKEFVIEGNPHPLTDLQKRLLGKLQQFHKAVRISEQVCCLGQIPLPVAVRQPSHFG